MKTDLADLSINVTASICEDDPSRRWHTKYGEIVNTVRRSATPRIHITAYDSTELRHAASIGLILSDAVIVIGCLNFRADDSDGLWPRGWSFEHIMDEPLPLRVYEALGGVTTDTLCDSEIMF